SMVRRDGSIRDEVVLKIKLRRTWNVGDRYVCKFRGGGYRCSLNATDNGDQCQYDYGKNRDDEFRSMFHFSAPSEAIVALAKAQAAQAQPRRTMRRIGQGGLKRLNNTPKMVDLKRRLWPNLLPFDDHCQEPWFLIVSKRSYESRQCRQSHRT